MLRQPKTGNFRLQTGKLRALARNDIAQLRPTCHQQGHGLQNRLVPFLATQHGGLHHQRARMFVQPLLYWRRQSGVGIAVDTLKIDTRVHHVQTVGVYRRVL